MAGAKSNFVDLTPLRVSPAFARLWFGAALSGIGAQMTVMAVGLQIFEITRSTLMVGLVGGIALIPMIFAGPWGGMLADVMDRRKLLLGALVAAWISTVGLLILAISETFASARGEHISVWPFYLFTTITAMSYVVNGAARKAVYPRILDAANIPKANALNGMSIGLQFTLGPALAGVLVATVGFPSTFTIDLVLACAGFLGVVMLPAIPPQGKPVIRGWAGVKEGLQFLLTAPNIRTSFLTDIIAMGLGRPYALLPAVAALVVGGGPTTVGVLTAAAAVGTFGASIFSGYVGRTYRYGIAIGRATISYGVFVMLFGVVILGGTMGVFGPVSAAWNGVSILGLVLSALCFLGMGVSDEISAIFRTTILMTSAPDEMRGRLQGVFFSVVAGGPRLGDLFAGVLATVIALWAPALIGGVGIVVAIVVILRLNHSFMNYDIRDNQSRP